jgi:hypothetical protein
VSCVLSLTARWPLLQLPCAAATVAATAAVSRCRCHQLPQPLAATCRVRGNISGGFFCVRMEHIVEPQSSLVTILSLLACRVRGFFCVYRILFRLCRLVVPSASPRPLRSQPARSACEACMLCKFNDPAYTASSTTLHTQRAAGSRARVASKHCRLHRPRCARARTSVRGAREDHSGELATPIMAPSATATPQRHHTHI